MPRLSCWFIRSALLHLAAGVSLGGLLLFHKGIPFYPLMWRFLPLHIEILMFGWIVQLVMGVGFWIFPRFFRARGDVRPAWVAFVLLNLGVWLAGTGPMTGLVWLTVTGRFMEIGAAVAFALHTWPRIKPPGVRPS